MRQNKPSDPMLVLGGGGFERPRLRQASYPLSDQRAN
eukprot:CAMPEP_0180155350 /NCGR_PEP_ID=MMETSP0986-20121125/24768_1 /TAXON_ID=697907 /ORGANISM="non described non described, Strain CCMP2293" /LENGTH=36 /DNA_ID= /DNA_START= /DNA_END= /DNA_ORIENTATION=